MFSAIVLLQLSSKMKISETTDFSLKYATFWGGFHGEKFDFFISLMHFSNHIKKLLYKEM